MKEGYLDGTEKGVEPMIVMCRLIVSEIAGLLAILGGFIFVNFELAKVDTNQLK